MNGPESFGIGEVMATREKEVPNSKWTPEMIEKGEAILAYIKENIDTARVANKHVQVDMAGRALGYISKNESFYTQDPKNTKNTDSIQSYLEFVWRMESPEERVKRNLAQMKEDFPKQMKDPDFRHAKTHPEDELAV